MGSRSLLRQTSESLARSIGSRLGSVGVDAQRSLFEEHEKAVFRVHGKPPAWNKFQSSPDVCSQGQHCFESAGDSPISALSGGEAFIGNLHKDSEYRDLNSHHRFVDTRVVANAVSLLTKAHKSDIVACTRSPFRVVNVRAWATLPTAGYGTKEWHTDGYLDGHLKLMWFLNRLDVESGSIQFEGVDPLHADAGACVAFRNSNTMHRAVPGTLYERPVIEMTLQRLLVWPDDDSPFLGTNADRHLSDPFRAYTSRGVEGAA